MTERLRTADGSWELEWDERVTLGWDRGASSHHATSGQEGSSSTTSNTTNNINTASGSSTVATTTTTTTTTRTNDNPQDEGPQTRSQLRKYDVQKGIHILPLSGLNVRPSKSSGYMIQFGGKEYLDADVQVGLSSGQMVGSMVDLGKGVDFTPVGTRLLWEVPKEGGVDEDLKYLGTSDADFVLVAAEVRENLETKLKREREDKKRKPDRKSGGDSNKRAKNGNGKSVFDDDDGDGDDDDADDDDDDDDDDEEDEYLERA